MEKLLKTNRLYLRNLIEEDVPVIHGYRNDTDCARYQRWEDTSLEAIQSFVQAYETSRFLSRQEEQHYAICAGDTQVGDLSYFYTEADRCVTLGITIAPQHQRKGYARELLAAVLEAVQRTYPQLDIVALIDRENIPSLALFESLGFYRECYAEKIESYVYVIDGNR